MGVYKSIENGEPLRNKTIPCEAIQPIGGDKIKKCIVCGKLLPLEEFHKVDWMERVTTIPKGSTSK